jgi:hypothetical protein
MRIGATRSPRHGPRCRGRVSFWANARPLICGCSWVGSSHMRPLVPLRLLWHRVRPTLARPPAPSCLSVAIAALRPVPPLWRPTVSQTVTPSHPRKVTDGGLQHAPVLRESTMALTESVGSLISSVPLPWQHEDRGRKAAESLPPAPGAYSVTGDSPPFGDCSWTGSSHAPAGHPASLATPGSPDSGSNARPKLPPNSS